MVVVSAAEAPASVAEEFAESTPLVAEPCEIEPALFDSIKVSENSRTLALGFIRTPRRPETWRRTFAATMCTSRS